MYHLLSTVAAELDAMRGAAGDILVSLPARTCRRERRSSWLEEEVERALMEGAALEAVQHGREPRNLEELTPRQQVVAAALPVEVEQEETGMEMGMEQAEVRCMAETEPTMAAVEALDIGAVAAAAPM